MTEIEYYLKDIVFEDFDRPEPYTLVKFGSVPFLKIFVESDFEMAKDCFRHLTNRYLTREVRNSKVIDKKLKREQLIYHTPKELNAWRSIYWMESKREINEGNPNRFEVLLDFPDRPMRLGGG